MAVTIYLHWTATGYDWIRPGHYHSIISGDGVIHRLHSYNVDLPAHTWRRNSNSIALSCACMGGMPDPWTVPPTDAQLKSLCFEAASVAREWGWSAEQINLNRVMTHAEAASNRDGRIMHDNYGPVIWGGSGERWDLLQLAQNSTIDGGDQLRYWIREFLENPDEKQAVEERLTFQGFTVIKAKGSDLAVQIDQEGRSWARLVDLLERYEIAHVWDAESKRILIGALDVAPTFRDDALQASIGWPLIDVALQTRTAPIILRGILRPSEGGDRAWCRVVEFAEEFGISVRFDPLELGERRGG